MPARQVVSPHLAALGQLEYRKAFLILNYIGKRKLEDAISVDEILELKNLPMSTFESKVWRALCHNDIDEKDRRKNFDWDTRKPHVYHCYVDLQGQCTFEGPFLQNSRTHLQRVLGDENVLVVKFAEDDGADKNKMEHSGSNALYHNIAKNGILVGLRRYRFFVFKDGGKEEKKKNPHSSPVRCYFVLMETDAESDMQLQYILLNKSVHEARKIFMHIHNVPTISKYMARLSLILSKTSKLEVDMAHVNLSCIEDIPCMDEYGNIVYDEKGEPKIHTDGTGFISQDLAIKCPKNIYREDVQRIILQDGNKQEVSTTNYKYLIGEPPLLIQCRLFNDGCAVKGTLLLDKRLPPHTILIRPSMIKVDTDRNESTEQSVNSLEIVARSNQPKKASVSKFLIALLHYGGVPKEYFIELLMTYIEDAQHASLNKQAALAVAQRHGDMDNFLVSRMILCGIPLDEPYLQLRLSEHMNSEKKGLKNFKLPINDSYYLMGTVDPTGTLSCNQVCVILDSGQVSGEVLVYKHPGLHFGDVHVLTAIYVKDMEDIIGNAKYAIFFPTKGQRSLADEIANSDFDGDIYAISEAADSWLAYMDRLLTLSDECVEEKECLREKMLQLVDIYYDAVDAPKSGLKVKLLFHDVMVFLIHELQYGLEEILYGATEFNESTREREDIFKEAIAIYQVTYNYAKAEDDVGKCRFAWSVAGHGLCALHAIEQEKDAILCVSSVLRDILR
ncbi:putative RNA-dependent RNA polymerase 4 [Acorus gramineus]|uniref:RNA-dependent RNA polymerase n=1 Tax=Acorus gramineus TaxID=55184 RepID=A0AAV9APT9_ACOGR|nr:putative RNA-dependent RNA polymerase 4 [Acorus gramineus]